MMSSRKLSSLRAGAPVEDLARGPARPSGTRANEVGSPFGNREDRGLRVAGHGRRHDRRVDDTQAGHADHLQPRVDDGVRIPAEAARADGMKRVSACWRTCASVGAQHMVPQAVIKLKQGFGRLIRSCTDRGALVLLDSRVVRKQYGRVFFDSLPPARRIVAERAAVYAALQEFFSALPPHCPRCKPPITTLRISDRGIGNRHSAFPGLGARPVHLRAPAARGHGAAPSGAGTPGDVLG
jgi:hypothetical protein